MDTYNKLRQYNINVMSNKWINLGSIIFPSSTEIHNLKFEILYYDNKVNNIIVCHMITEQMIGNFTRYDNFYGNAVIYEVNHSNFIIKLIQLSNIIYGIWCNFDTYIGKALLYIYGDYLFQLENTFHDSIIKDYPTCNPIKYTFLNNANVYNKLEIDLIINNNFVTKTELNSKLLNLAINPSDNLSTVLNDNYIKINNISKYTDNFYTKQEINKLLEIKINFKELSNFIRKDEINNIIIDNSNLKNFYTKQEIDVILQDKIDKINVYNKSELKDILAKKIDIEDVLNKTETYHKTIIDNLLERKVPIYNGILHNVTINNSSFVGNVEGLSKVDVGLDNVDNTSDINKPISLQVLNQLNKKANISDLNCKADKSELITKASLNSPNFTGIVTGINKDMIGLHHVDNTSDINKPLSKAIIEALNNKADINLVNTKADQISLNLKAPINNPTFTGIVNGITKHMVELGNVNNTSDDLKPLSKAVKTELELKANISELNLKASIDSPTFTGIVKGITKEMIGLNNVDNTPDLLKPITVEMHSKLNLKAPINNPTFTGIVKGITKEMIGLNNVDNTLDIYKPLSNLMIEALDKKASINNPSFTGNVYGITKDMVGLSDVDNTKDINKPISVLTQKALDNKVNINNPLFTGSLSIDNMLIYDNNNSSFFNTTNDNLCLRSNMILCKSGQTIYDCNIENDFAIKIKNTGFGIVIDNSTQYALCIRDKVSRIKTFIGPDNTAMIANTISILNNKVGINNNNPSYDLHIDGMAYCSRGIWEPSDTRIKTNIENINVLDTLKLINNIRLTKYNFTFNNKTENYGVIAQEIEKILPDAISKSVEIIPSIMKFYDITVNNSQIIYKDTEFVYFTINIEVNFFNFKLESNQKLRVYNKHFTELNSIYEDVVIKYDITLSYIILDIQNINFLNINSIYIYGHEVNDFNSIDKNKLFMPLIGAVQSLTQMNKNLEDRLKNLEDR